MNTLKLITEGLTAFAATVLFIDRLVVSYLLPFWKKRNGNGEKECPIIEHRILDLESHAKIANDEMGEIRKDISDIKSDISFIRGKLDK